jgi:hypothetical protein
MRLRKQQQQQAMWINTQISEKMDSIQVCPPADCFLTPAQRKKIEDEHYSALLQAVDAKRQELAELQAAASRHSREETAAYNRALAEAKREESRRKKLAEDEDSVAEITNQLASDILNERIDTTISHVNPNRYIKYNFKGLRPDVKEAIQTEQKVQMEVKKEIGSKAKSEDVEWDVVQEAVRRNMIASDKEMQRRRQEISRQLLEEQKRQADEFKAR